MTEQPKQPNPQQPQPQPQQQPVLSSQIQQCLTTLGIRTNDFLQQVNTTINALIQENQQLQNQLKELQAPVKQQQTEQA